MAKTFKDLVTDFGTFTNDSSQGNLSLGANLINLGVRKILGMANWTFNKESKTYSTGSSQQYYAIPYNLDKPEEVYFYSGSIWHTPTEVRDSTLWQRLNSTVVYSDVPSHWYISEEDKQIGIYPIPTTRDNTIKVVFPKKIVSFGTTTYATGTASGSSSGTIITGWGGASWTDNYLGWGFKFYNTNTRLDNYYFNITDISSSGTTLRIAEQLPKNVASGSYEIAQMIPMAEGFEDLPLYFALDQYYSIKEKNNLALNYRSMWVEGTDDMKTTDFRSAAGILTKQTPINQIDPNVNPWAISIE